MTVPGNIFGTNLHIGDFNDSNDSITVYNFSNSIATFYGDAETARERANRFVKFVEMIIEGQGDGPGEGQEGDGQVDMRSSEYKEKQDQFKISSEWRSTKDNPLEFPIELSRYLCVKLFLGSTIEEVDLALNTFLTIKNICIGNYRDIYIVKEGGVYQLALVYAELR